MVINNCYLTVSLGLRLSQISLVFVGMLLMSGCGDSCGKEGGAAQAVRSLTIEQKESVFREASACMTSSCDLQTLLNLDFHWQRGAKLLRRHDKGNVVLAMCFDYGADLKFTGLGTDAGMIELTYGEFKDADFGSEIIWQKSPSKTMNVQ